MDVTRLAAFGALWFVLGLSPGPNAAFCIATGLSHRLRDAMAVPIGMGLASFVHVTVAAAGAGAIFAQSPMAFQVLKFAGAGYLAWLGIKRWVSKADILDVSTGSKEPRHFELLRRGIVVSLTNPKAILQYVAVLPQFIDASAPAAPQFVALALVGAPVVAADYAIYTAGASSVARTLTKRRARWVRRATGAIYVLAALVLATR